MILRILNSLVLTFGLSSHAWACSCAPWDGGNVSELSDEYVILWGVPTKAQVEYIPKHLVSFRVSYDLEVLESFGQIRDEKLIIYSYGVNSGSCGVRLPMGKPQVLVLHKNENRNLEIGQCSPELPYELVKKYLTSRIDTFVPGLDECVSAKGELKLDIAQCRSWESSYKNWNVYGLSDLRKYEKLWMNRAEKYEKKKKP